VTESNQLQSLSTRDRLLKTLSGAALWSSLAVLALMLLFLARETGLMQGKFPAGAVFSLRTPWSPLATPPSFGLGHAWVATLVVTGFSLLLAVPLGIGIGIFAAEIAPPKLSRILQPALELLAGIPAVVYGFFGYVTFVKWFGTWFDLPTGESLLAASLVLAIMILPFIASTSAEALRIVYRDYREAVLGLGVTQGCLFRRVVLKKALPGLAAAVALGLARALGETLAVLMLSGNTAALPDSFLSRGQPLTALLATELGETAAGSPKYQVLFGAACLLLLIVLGLNVFILLLKRRLLEQLHD
jgi:phosphate transport system permease protein